MKLSGVKSTATTTTSKIRTAILIQDDIAPDSLECFAEDFKRKVGMSLGEFRKKAFRVSLKMEVIYCHKMYRLSWCCNDPFYILYKDS